MTISTIGGRGAATRTNGPASPPPPPADPPSEPQDKSLLTRVVSTAVGVGFGVTGAVVHGAAGGAAGLTHGADLKGAVAQRAFLVTMAANLAINGAVPLAIAHMAMAKILTAAATSVAGGYLQWSIEDKGVQQQVKDTAADWTDRVWNQLNGGSKATDNPTQPAPNPPSPTPPTPPTPPAPPLTLTKRILRGALGEAVGYAAGASVGYGSYYARGKAFGERAMHAMAEEFNAAKGE